MELKEVWPIPRSTTRCCKFQVGSGLCGAGLVTVPQQADPGHAKINHLAFYGTFKSYPTCYIGLSSFTLLNVNLVHCGEI